MENIWAYAEELMRKGLAIDKIAREIGKCRDTIRARYPQYKGNRGQKTDEQIDARYGKKQTFVVECVKCHKLFSVVEREKRFPSKQKYFCTLKCAKSRDISVEGYASKRIKLSKAAIHNWNTGVLTTNRKRCFSSKGERELRELLKLLLPNGNWKTGALGYKGIQRDIYSDELKVAIEYDGIWHFRNIKDQLRKKTRKDVFYEQWCVRNQWTLIRVDEDTFRDYRIDVMNKIIEMINQKKCGKLWNNSNVTYLKNESSRPLSEYLTRNVLHM
jgi:hypothetical protein